MFQLVQLVPIKGFNSIDKQRSDPDSNMTFYFTMQLRKNSRLLCVMIPIRNNINHMVDDAVRVFSAEIAYTGSGNDMQIFAADIIPFSIYRHLMGINPG